MNSRSMTGWLLIFGPLLTFVIWGFLYDAVIGSSDTSTESVAQAMANPELARLIGSFGILAFAAMFVGLNMLSRPMMVEGNAGSGFATVAGILFVLTAAIVVTAGGMNYGIMEIMETDVVTAEMIDAVSNGTFAGIQLTWSVGMLLLGIAVWMQKNLPMIIALLFIGFSAVMIVGTFTTMDLDNVVGMIMWMGLSLSIVAAGVLTLKAKSTG
ncbi:hypothetical protein FIM02_01570 [SAR202 cluster bacterium AD-802-E10_MRT_200m]|nr:hypothetical protein [SAR202 cluster bacterium AD-802-E10_MRT_200m]